MDAHITLAKKAVEKYVIENIIIEVSEDVPEGMITRRAGVFVTIFKNGDLRGCIGTYLPTRESIAREIILNAVAACSRDHRFDQVVENELAYLKYEVSILAEPRKIKDIQTHDPKKRGVLIISSDGRSGLLLPDLDGIETSEQQIEIASRKGGIDLLRDSVELFSFGVEKHTHKDIA
ncbi:MAG: AmmeMemoRadiSam system protein A [Patescibacteria group bacterium]|nr:AmmeMemoRadiSam system protein A [Patescibacteria group bacterium]